MDGPGQGREGLGAPRHKVDGGRGGATAAWGGDPAAAPVEGGLHWAVRRRCRRWRVGGGLDRGREQVGFVQEVGVWVWG